MFWRRRRDEPAETAQPEAHEEVDLDAAEPDPSAFDPDPTVATAPEAPAPAPADPVLGPLARAAAMKPLFADADADIEIALEQGLERTRGGFMTRLRDAFAAGPDGAAWDDVEETLIAGDVGAALAMDVVERARKRRDPGGPEASVRAELAALL